MKAIPLLALILLGQGHPSKPPKLDYDKVRDETFAHTGEIKFRKGSSFSYLAGYVYRGKEPKRPQVIILNFYALRINETGNPASDSDYAKWQGLKEITLRWSTDPKTYEVRTEKSVMTDSMTKILVGRAFAERIRAEIPVGEFIELANSKELVFELGNHTETFKENLLKPMKALVVSLPNE
ncbi:MAG: hypothetical protein MUC92_07765 [Fimbriimonadaceae bacterium]|jgi:hypothetical protein|nr:hypothetical protein [Fimbriimonadaceae bacterium]